MSIRNIASDCGKLYEEKWKCKYYQKKEKPGKLDRIIEKFLNCESKNNTRSCF